MADNTIKNKIILEGEAQYKRAMADITRALKENKSAVKAAAAEFDNSADSMQAQYRLGDALERQYNQQSNALDLMCEQLDKVESAYGTNSREAVDLRTKINNMRTEMAKTSTQLRDFQNGLDSVAMSAPDAARSVGEIGESAEEATDDVGSLTAELSDLAASSVSDLAVRVGSVAGAAKGVAEALTLGNEQTQAWSLMSSYTGATGKALEDMKNAALSAYKDGLGESLNDVAQGTAQISTYTGLVGDGLENAVRSGYLLDETFGMDIPENARSASQLMTNFGVSGEEAYDIIATAAQRGADKNGNLLDTINEYSPYFAKSGKSAEEFGTALTLAADNGVYDVDKVGDAWKEFTIRLTDGSDSTKEALKALGLESSDIPTKFAEGGEAADEATNLVIDRLSQVEDPLERNRLGVALFGTQWEDTNGAVLKIFGDMDKGMGDTQTALDTMNETRLSDLDEALQGLDRRIRTIIGEFTSPGAKVATAWINGINAALDSGNVGDIWDTASAQIAGQKQAERDALVEQGYTEQEAIQIQVVGMWPDGKPQGTVVGWIKDLFSNEEASTAVSESVTQLATDAQTTLDAAMDTAMPQSGNNAVTQIQTGMMAEEEKMRTAGRESAEAAIEAVDAEQPDMLDAGDELGGAGVVGAKAGLLAMPEAGRQGAAGLTGGLRTAVASSYAAGYDAGKAFERGFKVAQDQHSPSRVMQDAGELSVDGLMLSFDEGESRVYAAGEALGQALTDGYGSAQGGAFGAGYAQAGGAIESPSGLVDAMLEALERVVVYLDKEPCGRLMAPGVSREISSQAGRTMAGRFSSVKGW